MQFTPHPDAAKDIKAVAKISSQEASLAADVVARSSRMRRRTEIQRFHRCICLYYVLSSKRNPNEYLCPRAAVSALRGFFICKHHIFLVNLAKKGHDIRIHQSEHRQANGGEPTL